MIIDEKVISVLEICIVKGNETYYYASIRTSGQLLGSRVAHTEQYVSVVNQKKYRSAYAKFRCGVAPIKIETCRYGLQRVPVEQRLCET